MREALTDARMVFVCAGLGGGTGSGAAPAVAQIARESGALVVAFATLPFAFEGKRRIAQAQEALAELQRAADAVVCFENDRMGDMVAPKAGIHQAFAVADITISQSVRSIVNVDSAPGLDPDRFRRIALRAAQPERPLPFWFRRIGFRQPRARSAHAGPEKSADGSRPDAGGCALTFSSRSRAARA